MTPQGIERLKKEAAAAVQAAATFRALAEKYRGWGDARSLSEATRLESNADWYETRAKLWGAAS